MSDEADALVQYSTVMVQDPGSKESVPQNVIPAQLLLEILMKCRRRSYYYAVDGMRLGMSNHPDFNRHLGQIYAQLVIQISHRFARMALWSYLVKALMSISKFHYYTPWGVIRGYTDTPFTAFASLAVLCFTTFLSFNFILLRVRDFLEWKMRWRIQSKKQTLRACEKDVTNMIVLSNCNPIMLRLAWSDAGTYDKNVTAWPLCGGCNGSIRFENENQQTVNKGLGKAISLLLPFKMKYPSISWADLIQMAGTRAVKACGGPSITIRYGRVDLPKEFFADEKENSEFCLAQSKKLPCNSFPYPDGSHTPEFHIRNVFFRLGFSSREIVALCGGHTIGRGFKDRTGVCPFSSGDRGATTYTRLTSLAKGTDEGGIGMAGGMSWTENWLQFDNSYYRRPHNSRKEKEKEKERRRGKKGLSSQEVSVEDRMNEKRLSLAKSVSSSNSNVSDRTLSDGTKSLRVGETSQEQVQVQGQGQVQVQIHSSREGAREVSAVIGDASCSDSTSNCSSPGSRSIRRLSSSPSVSSYCPFSGHSELLWLPTDDALCKAPEFKFYFEQYAADQKLFFSDYALAHRKMSELGARFDPPEGIET